MSRTYFALTVALVAFSAGPAAFGTGAVLFQDNFESYGSTAAMQAVWNSGGLGTLDTALAGANVNSMSHPGGTDNTHTFNPAAVVPTDTSPVVWQFDFYWDGNTNKRITGGLRDDGTAGNGVTGSPNGILEMGYYNDALNSATSVNDEGFAYRTIFLPGSTNWVLFMKTDNSAPVTPAANSWNTFQAIIKGTSIDFMVDLGRDGTWDAAATVAADSTGVAYNSARFGGPSNLSSGGGGGNFDNLSIFSLTTGDANMDGTITADDYALIDRGFAMHLTGWSNGDFNSDGTIDQNDYLLIDTAYAQQLGGAPAGLLAERTAEFGPDYAGLLVASVPEPVTVIPLTVLAFATLSRRRVRTLSARF